MSFYNTSLSNWEEDKEYVIGFHRHGAATESDVD